MSTIVAGKLVTMLLLMCVGVVLKQKGYLSDEGTQGISVVLNKVGVPANMIILLQREYSAEIMRGFWLAAGGALAMCVAATALFYVLGRFARMRFPQIGLFVGGGVFSNILFMGLPLVLAVYGTEGAIYCISVTFVSNVYFYTVCTFFLSKGCGAKKTLRQMGKDIVTNWICISAVLGLILFTHSILLPQPIADVLQYATDANICLSMIFIGAVLANAGLSKAFCNRQVLLFCLASLILMPILTRVVMAPFLSGMELGILVLLMGTPTAAVLPAYASVCGNDAERASAYVFVSTILSAVSLPLVVHFLCPV